ncbi:MAG: hypothetical protein ACREBG_20520 [Pyrinomonadaceae bacterium]
MSGKLSSATDPFGRTLSFLTNMNGRVISVADATGIIADYTYGSGGQLLSVTYADNSRYQFSCDGSFRLTSVTDALGNILEAHSYDGQGRASSSEKQGGSEHYTLNYTNATRTDVTDALGRVTKYFFNSIRGRNRVNFSGLAVAGSPNRMLGNGVGDTPFGVYNFTGTQGGQPSSRLGDGFGTGKILMEGLFGEIMDSGRSLIRLHGGGSGLRRRNQDPYSPEHDLLPTQGCVRMKNGDVNALIQAIKNLPKGDPLEFIFVGDSPYLNNLANDPNQAHRRWQPVLRTNLGIPNSP